MTAKKENNFTFSEILDRILERGRREQPAATSITYYQAPSFPKPSKPLRQICNKDIADALNRHFDIQTISPDALTTEMVSLYQKLFYPSMRLWEHRGVVVRALTERSAHVVNAVLTEIIDRPKLKRKERRAVFLGKEIIRNTVEAESSRLYQLLTQSEDIQFGQSVNPVLGHNMNIPQSDDTVSDFFGEGYLFFLTENEDEEEDADFKRY